MPLIYAQVVREDGTVLADYALLKGNAAVVAQECMQVGSWAHT